jgi:nucleoside phosphorylase
VTWDMLKRMGVRTVLGLEMEAAIIGEVAKQCGIGEWIVIKGVMDHADPNKADRFKPFAARASAETLRNFLIGRFSV